MPDPYDTDTYRALLAAIKAAPDDDLPRLVMADYLDAEGEADRAEFIRCSVGLFRGQAADQRRVNRIYDLLLAHWRRWLPPGASALKNPKAYNRDYFWPAITFQPSRRVRGHRGNTADFGGPAVMVIYRNGFADEVEADTAWWVRLGDALLAREPVRHVTLADEDHSWATESDWQAAYRYLGVTEEEFRGGDDDLGARVTAALYFARWPGVEFVLPFVYGPAPSTPAG